jgi:catechol 2,3-dioxygenase-like lactoylglutathione lyase family enzyme
MATQLDHMILRVNDLQQSIDFYTRILGLHYEGARGPFAVIRVTDALTLQLAPWTTLGGEHLAFAMTRGEFEDVFRRAREAGVEYGDSFHSVGNMQGPGAEEGARGLGTALYLFDPNEHLIEIRYYESRAAPPASR